MRKRKTPEPGINQTIIIFPPEISSAKQLKYAHDLFIHPPAIAYTSMWQLQSSKYSAINDNKQ